MPLLQIDVQGTDAEGNVAISTVEVDVTQPPAPAADAVITPGTVQAAATMHGAGAARVTAETSRPLRPGEARAQAQAGEPRFGDKPVTVPGLGNESLGGRRDQDPAPRVTQAVRSTTLFRNTGGFR
jgi:hypothetical protein